MAWNNTDDENDGADLGFDVDATEPEEAMSFEVLKRGDYPILITGCEPKAGRQEGSRYVKMEVTIIAGPGKGRKVWGNFSTHLQPKDNSKEAAERAAKAVRIGRGHIKSAFAAAGVTGSSPIDLVAAQTPMIGVIGVEKGNDAYPDDKNTIRGFKAMSAEQQAALESGESPAPEKTKTTTAPAKSSRPGFLKQK